MQGQVFLKGGKWHFSYLIFSRSIIFTFRNYFTLCKIGGKHLELWSMSLRKIGFFGTTFKPIYCKIIDSVPSSVGFIFKTVLFQQYIKIYTKIYQIHDGITTNEWNNCNIQKWVSNLVSLCKNTLVDTIIDKKKHFHHLTSLFLRYCWWCWTVSNDAKGRY